MALTGGRGQCWTVSGDENQDGLTNVELNPPVCEQLQSSNQRTIRL